MRRPALLMDAGGMLIDALPPSSQQRVRRWLGRPGPRLITLDDLNAELAQAATLFASSEDRARIFLQGFALEPPGRRPTDPLSEAYRMWTWDLYRRISGQAVYSTANEASPFDLESAVVRPFPYQTGSPQVVGRDLAARGHLLRCIGENPVGLVPPARIVEFGPGWGNLTNDLVATGFDVTAVEVDPQFCQLIERRCPDQSRLTVTRQDMLAFEPDGSYDAAVFFESFHHCADHLAMLQKLHSIVRPGGAVYFASEPVQPMPYPWGPRLDGLSLWSTRTYGWLELGFAMDYFDLALARTGWHAERHQMARRPHESDVLVATADPSWTA